jgi:S-DNA-T family DNA segregation ATPase FtsK/SpoIIIE
MTLSIRAGSQVSVTATFALAVVGGPSAGRSVPLGFAPVRVGRAPDNDLVVDEPTMSARHATVTPSTAGLAVADHSSTNGVRIDGYVLSSAPPGEPVPIGALIRLGDSLLRVGLTGEPAAPARPDGRGHLLVQRTATVSRSDPPDPSPPDVPAVPDRRPVPLLAGLVAGALGVVLALVLGSWMYLAIAAAGPVTALATAAAERIGGRRRRRRVAADRERASASWSAAVCSVESARRESAWERCPDPGCGRGIRRIHTSGVCRSV